MHAYAHAHVPRHPHIHTHTQTNMLYLLLFHSNNDSGTRLNITLYIHCLSCSICISFCTAWWWLLCKAKTCGCQHTHCVRLYTLISFLHIKCMQNYTACTFQRNHNIQPLHSTSLHEINRRRENVLLHRTEQSHSPHSKFLNDYWYSNRAIKQMVGNPQTVDCKIFRADSVLFVCVCVCVCARARLCGE